MQVRYSPVADEFARSMERLHPGTRWTPCRPDDKGAVSLGDPAELNTLRQRCVRRWGSAYTDAVQRALQ